MTTGGNTRSNSPGGIASPDECAEGSMPAFVNLKIARRYMESPESIDISRAKGISENAARVLVAYQVPLAARRP